MVSLSDAVWKAIPLADAYQKGKGPRTIALAKVASNGLIRGPGGEFMSYRYATDVLEDEQDLDENFVVRHWRGHLSLQKSWFLVGGALSAIVFVMLDAALAWFGGWTDSLQSVAIATLLFFLSFLVVRTWAIVGIWRSADHHGARGGSEAWALIAKLLLILGVLLSLFQAGNYGLMVAEYGRLALGRDTLGKPIAMELVDDGRTLSLNGAFASGSWPAFKRMVEANPAIELITLASPGGRIFDADKIAGLIRAKGIDTQVIDQCASACTIVLLAGRHRMAGRLSKVGFHQPDFPGMDPATRTSAIADNSRLYREAGIKQPFIDRMMATAPSNMWYPTYDELIDAGVLTGDETPVAGRAPPIDSVAIALAREVEASLPRLPIRIDQLTQLTGVTADKRVLRMDYRIARLIGPDQARAIGRAMAGSLKLETCGVPTMRRYVDAGATLTMAYRDQRNRHLFEVAVSSCG